jgi:translation initiation factor IF-3
MNERIRSPQVRVIDGEGGQLGIMAPFEALKIARERNLDLVEISPNAQPPVVKIMDFGKFLYEQEKKERAAKKHQKVITIKEVKFSINVDEHDYVTKRNHVIRFLGEGDKVKASLRFRGREMAHRDLGRGVLDRLIKDVKEHAVIEFAPRMEGNTMHAILAPKKIETKAPKPQPAGA